MLAGDTPLLRPESLKGLLDEQATHKAGCVIGTAVTEANQGLGRIVRNTAGEFVAIVEQKDATPEQLAIQEINTGCYAFPGRPRAAVISGGLLSVHKLRRTDDGYRLADKPLASFRLDPYVGCASAHHQERCAEAHPTAHPPPRSASPSAPPVSAST